MNLYDKIKSPFEDVETIRTIIKNFSDNNVQSSGEMYHFIIRNNNESIDNALYMDSFDENIYWPLLENDWKSIEDEVAKKPALKKIYDRFGSYKELYNYINSLDKETRVALGKYNEYSKPKNPDMQLVNKYKTILYERTSNVGELLAAYSLYKNLPQLHTFQSQELMGFHFDSNKHDGTVNKENPEIKFYLNAGEDSFRVAKLFLDKCRKAKVDSYYFKVVDPMYGEQVRDDKLCIYSTIEHSKTFLEFITEIKKENPDITFRKPPLTAGTIDNFIGVGTDTLDNNCSYNQTMSDVVYETLNDICVEKDIYHRDLYSYLEKNPEILDGINENLIQGSIEKGCSSEKTCVSDKLGERLKTVEIADTAPKTENIDKNEKGSSQVIKGSMQVYDENGNIIIQEQINPTLIERKIKLPSGNEISASQYIQEFVVPHIPESGTFKLKNGAEISAKQYIEELVLGEGQTKYHGDIEALINDTVQTDKTPKERGTSGNTGPGVGMGQTQVRYFNDKEEEKNRNEEVEEEPSQYNSFKKSLEPKNELSKEFKQSMQMQRNALRIGKEAVMEEQTAIAVEQQLRQKQTKRYGMSL